MPGTFWLLAFLFFFLPGNANSQTTQGAEEAERARKFNEALSQLNRAANPGVASDDAHWTFSARVDELTRKTIAHASIIDTRTIKTRLEPLSLSVGCTSQGFRVIVTTEDYWGDRNGAVRVQYRIDDGELVTTSASPSTTGKAALFTGQRGIGLARKLMNGSKITMRVYDFRGSYGTMTFNLRSAGSTESIEQAIKACGMR